MPRGKRIIIETEVKDAVVENLLSLDIKKMAEHRQEIEKKIEESVREAVDQATKHLQHGKLDPAIRKKLGLFTLEEAYEELKRAGFGFSFRAFAGRVERKSIKSVKVGRYRYIPLEIIKDLANIRSDFYTMNEAYLKISAYEEDLNIRAFIGRVEKGSIPSLKIGTMRLIPKVAINSLIHIAQNYYTVSQAIKKLWENDIKLKRNAFERRLDRGRIPSVKVGGRRVIAKEVLDELIRKELALRQKEMQKKQELQQQNIQEPRNEQKK
ncbi:MAG: helix-turn-helix domain-containing protein [Candidatus Anstonellales archaeon]